MSARTEYLIYFPDTPAYEGARFLGVMPAHYVLCTDFDRADALDAGGRDVSCNDAHWAQWERDNARERVS
jgi:hypothetical protein